MDLGEADLSGHAQLGIAAALGTAQGASRQCGAGLLVLGLLVGDAAQGLVHARVQQQGRRRPSARRAVRWSARRPGRAAPATQSTGPARPRPAPPRLRAGGPESRCQARSATNGWRWATQARALKEGPGRPGRAGAGGDEHGFGGTWLWSVTGILAQATLTGLSGRLVPQEAHGGFRGGDQWRVQLTNKLVGSSEISIRHPFVSTPAPGGPCDTRRGVQSPARPRAVGRGRWRAARAPGAWLTDADGRVLGEGEAGPGPGPGRRAYGMCCSGREAAAQGVPGFQPGLRAGLRSLGTGRGPAGGLCRQLPWRRAAATLMSDLPCCARRAWRLQPGGFLIAGTGSIEAIGRVGQLPPGGGWGWLNDEGGAWLAARPCATPSARGRSRCPRARWRGVCHLRHHARRPVWPPESPQAGQAELATLAPLVFEHAERMPPPSNC